MNEILEVWKYPEATHIKALFITLSIKHKWKFCLQIYNLVIFSHFSSKHKTTNKGFVWNAHLKKEHSFALSTKYNQQCEKTWKFEVSRLNPQLCSRTSFKPFFLTFNWLCSSNLLTTVRRQELLQAMLERKPHAWVFLTICKLLWTSHWNEWNFKNNFPRVGRNFFFRQRQRSKLLRNETIKSFG